jgi:hypothetical protein
LRYDTVVEDGEYVLAEGGESVNSQRKKRNRRKECPKENAIRFMEEHQNPFAGMLGLVRPPPSLGGIERVTPAHEREDFWAGALAEEGADEAFAGFTLF